MTNKHIVGLKRAKKLKKLGTWKSVVGYEGLYAVSDTGKVKSVKRNMIRKTKITHDGRESIALSKNNKTKYHFIHRLMLGAFTGTTGEQANHLDGNPLNNNLENLEWSNQKDNMRHAVINGLRPRGETHPMAKFTEEQVIEIRTLFDIGVGAGLLIFRFGLSKSQFYKIISKQAWGHI